MKSKFTLSLFIVSILAMFQFASAATATFNVTVPEGTNACYIMGNFTGASWPIAGAVKCDKVDATHYTVVLDEANFQNGVTLATLNYKYLSGPGDWTYVEKDAAGAEISDRSFTASPQADVVIKWSTVWVPREALPKTVTIDAFVPLDVVQLYIVGTFNGWTIPTDSTKMTLKETTPEGKVFTVTFFSKDVYLLKYKFCAGPSWDYEQTVGDFTYPDVTQSSAVEVITAFKKIYDPTKVGNINITATVPAGTTRTWIMGSHLGWNWSNLQEGIKNLDGTFSFTATNVMSMEYRLYNWNTDWTHPEAEDTDPTKERSNRKAEYPADTNISITVSAWRNAAPTGLNNLDASKYKVYSKNNSIVVEGVSTQAQLFDISGRLIESKNMSGSYNSVKLNSGLYIVKVDGQTQKVSVK
jgi:hypothetical protein